MLEAGAVDGCTKKSAMTVDGLRLEDNLEILESLRNIVKGIIKKESAMAG